MANESKIIEIHVDLGAAIADIAKLQESITALTEANKANTKSTDAQKKAYAENTVKIKEYRSQLNSLIKEAANESKVMVEKLGHIQRLKADVSNLTLAYERLTEAELKGAKGKEVLTALKEKRAELSQLNEAYGNYSLGVGNYGRATNNLSIQLGQVMKELPNFAISARTGIMSLTNNLPMLAEAFKQVKVQQADMIKEGQKAPSMFSLITKSIFGLTGIVSLAMVALQYFSDDIIRLITNTTKADEAQKKFNDTLKEGSSIYNTSAKSINEMDVKLRLASQGLLDSDGILKEYNSTLGNTFGVATDVKGAMENIATYKTDYLNAMVAMAAANTIFEESTRKASEALAMERAGKPGFLDYLNTIDKTIGTAFDPRNWGVGAFPTILGRLANTSTITYQNYLNDIKNLRDGSLKDISSYEAEIEKIKNKYKNEPFFSQIFGGDSDTFTKLNELTKTKQDLLKQKFNEESRILENGLKKNLITQDVFDKSMLNLKKEYNKDLKKLNDEGVNKQLLKQFDYESKILEERGKSLVQGRERELAAVEADYTKKLNLSLKHIKDLEQQEKNGVKGATAALADARKKHSEYEIALQESTNRKKLEINIKYDKLAADYALSSLKNQYDKFLVENELSAQQEYDAQVVFLNKEANAKIDQLDLMALSEEEYAIKIKEIYDALALGLAKTEKARTKNLKNENQKRLQNELDSLTANGNAIFQNEDAIQKNKLAQMAINMKEEIRLAGDNEELKKSIRDKYAKQKIELESETQLKKVDKFKFWADQVLSVGNAVNKAMGALAQRELQMWAKANEGKAGFDEEYAAKKERLQIQAAKREKALGVFSAVISTAAAIIAALADKTIGAAGRIALSIAAGVTGAAQIATILATPIPTESSFGGSSSRSGSNATSTVKFHSGGVAGSAPDSPAKEQEITRTLLTTERVLSPKQTSIFDSMISSIASRGGADSVVGNVGANSTSFDTVYAAMSKALQEMPAPVMTWQEFERQQQRQQRLKANAMLK